MSVFLLPTRLLLAAVLGVAGVAKLLDRDGSRRALLDFGAPARPGRPTALVLPVVELGAAAALVPNASARWGALSALCLLGTFSVAIAVALLRGRRPSCHCFGRLHSAHPRERRRSSATQRLRCLQEPSSCSIPVLRTSQQVNGGSSSGSSPRPLSSFRRGCGSNSYARTGASSRVWTRSSGNPGAFHADALIGPAPAFDLPAAEGGRLSLTGLLGRGRPVLLVFGHSGCGPCRDLSLSLRAGSKTVSSRSRSPSRTRAPPSPRRRYEMSLYRPSARWQRRTASPQLRLPLMIDRDGRVASALAVGADAIAALVPGPTSQSSFVGGRQAGLALGLAAGGAVLAGAASAATSQRLSGDSLSVDDPELLGLRMTIKHANPQLAADSRNVQHALLSLSRAKRKSTARAAAQAALNRQRTHLLELSKALQAVPTGGEPAKQAKQLATRSLPCSLSD